VVNSLLRATWVREGYRDETQERLAYRRALGWLRSYLEALDPAGSGTVIAKVNLFNYVGVIVGSAVIGIIAGTGEDDSRLRLAFAVPAGLILLITALAPAFRVVDTARAAARQAAAARAGQAEAAAVRL